MVGMLQIITYMMGFYLVLKGVEILQIGRASAREDRKGMVVTGWITVGVCLIAAVLFIGMQDKQAEAVGTPSPTSLYDPGL